MTHAQQTAIAHPARLAIECVHPRFASFIAGGALSLVLTVNTGYE